MEGGGKKVGRGMLLGDVLSDCQPVTLSQLVKSVFVFVFVFVTARQLVTLYLSNTQLVKGGNK